MIASASKNAFDFRTLPAYREVGIAKAAGQTLGIPSPFFRRADAVRGTKVKIDGAWVENFASYDYLGLNQSETVTSSAAQGAATWGVSATASRLVGGERHYHAELEQLLAEFIGAEASLVMVSGHATNVAVIRTVIEKGDLVLVDALAHNSIFEGVRASHAEHLSFPHNDWGWVDENLSKLRGNYRNVLIAVEGLYSMDGDAPDLARFVEVKSRHDAWLMVDEAHSLGVLGRTGRGVCEETGVDPGEIEILMGTLSKSLCSCGGFIAGSAGLTDLLRYKAPGFVFSVGLSAPSALAAIASLKALAADPERVSRLRDLARHFLERAVSSGLDCGLGQGFAVVPVMIGDSIRAAWISNRMLERGFNVLPIIAPAVPNKSARLRFFLTSGHDEAVLDEAIDAMAALVSESSGLSAGDMGDQRD
ncbi:MAG: aminotransferase class I/II-fold pyridoxal phosphate-dependent enzyme [Paracoccaceae bacterium]